MPIRKQAHAEPLPGYFLVEQLGKGGCGEVWKCEVPGGLFKAVKFVHGDVDSIEDDQAAVEDEWQAIQHVKSIRHPFLLSMERVERIDDELMIVTELADRNLHQLLEEYQRGGHAGIPRDQLLQYLRETAEVLDVINFKHGLQHLDVKPKNLFLVYNHIKVGDFGLVHSLSARGASTEANLQIGAITPLYASPELFQGQIGSRCDQYSLAVTYQELLTGQLPFQGENSRQLLIQHTKEQPNLDALPEYDRPLIARALAKNPEDRFPTCTDLIDCLKDAALTAVTPDTLPLSELREVQEEVPATVHVDQLQEPGEKDDDNLADTHRLPQPEQAQRDTDHKLTDTDRPQPVAEVPAASAAKPAEAAEAKKVVLVGPYRLAYRINVTPLAEKWLVETPEGKKRLLKYLYGIDKTGEALDHLLLRLRSLQHPMLIPMEVVDKEIGRVAVVIDRVERNLRSEYRQCRQKKLRGIPRIELLDILAVVAEGLDYLYRQHSLQHLNLHPGQILINRNGRVLLDDFGYIELLWGGSRAALEFCNRRYVAPELSQGQLSPKCDQYSLALIYAEMLLGQMPSSHDMRGQSPQVNMDALPEEDRDIVARALHRDPDKRWPNCGKFIAALGGDASETSQFSEYAVEQFNTVIQSSKEQGTGNEEQESGYPQPKDTASAADLKKLIDQLMLGIGGLDAVGDKDQVPHLSEDGQTLTHHFSAGLPLGEARLKLDAAREQMYGYLIEDNANRFLFHINMTANFWQQWMGLQPGLRVAVCLTRQRPLVPTPIQVDLKVTPFQCGKKRGRELLVEAGMDLLEQLRAVLLLVSQKRINDRLLWPHPVEVTPVLEDGSTDEPVSCRGKDLSVTGIGFYLPHQLTTSEVLVTIAATEHTDAICIPATLVRAKACADGWYEVGALFRVTAFRKSFHEIVLPCETP